MASLAWMLVFVSLTVELTPVESAGISILYNMTNGFLHAIKQNSTLNDLVDLFGNMSSLVGRFGSLMPGSGTSGGFLGSGTDITAIMNGLLSVVMDILPKLLLKYIGFTICGCLGLAMVLGMLFACLCFGPRRLCGSCGAGIRKKPQQIGDGIKRIVLAVIILALVGLIAAGIACTFLAGQQLTDQFKANSTDSKFPRILNSIVTATSTLTNYLVNLSETIVHLLTQIPDLFSKFQGIINGVIMQLKTELNSTLSTTTERIRALDANINNVINSSSSPSVQTQLNETRRAISSIDLSFQLPNSSLMTGNPVSKILNDTARLVETALSSLNLSQLLDLESKLGSQQTVMTQITKFGGDVGSSVLTSVSSALVGIVGLSLLGLFIGVVAPKRAPMSDDEEDDIGEKGESGKSKDKADVEPKQKSSPCNRGVSEKLFIAGAQSSFLISTVVMLVVVLFFIVGGFMYVEVCYDITHEDQNGGLFSFMDNLLQTLGQSNFLPSYLNLSSFSIHDVIYVKCKDGGGIFDSLFNVIDFQQLLNKFLPDDILNQTLPINNLIQISPTVYEQLANLSALSATDLNVSVTDQQSLNKSAVALSENLHQLQNSISSLIPNLTKSFKSQLVALVQQELLLVSNKTNCRALYDGLHGIFFAVCSDFLDPFNALWFSFAWCITLLIPNVIIGVYLGGLYARRPKSKDSTSKEKKKKPKGKKEEDETKLPKNQDENNETSNRPTEDLDLDERTRALDPSRERASLPYDAPYSRFIPPPYPPPQSSPYQSPWSRYGGGMYNASSSYNSPFLPPRPLPYPPYNRSFPQSRNSPYPYSASPYQTPRSQPYPYSNYSPLYAPSRTTPYPYSNYSSLYQPLRPPPTSNYYQPIPPITPRPYAPTWTPTPRPYVPGGSSYTLPYRPYPQPSAAGPRSGYGLPTLPYLPATRYGASQYGSPAAAAGNYGSSLPFSRDRTGSPIGANAYTMRY